MTTDSDMDVKTGSNGGRAAPKRRIATGKSLPDSAVALLCRMLMIPSPSQRERPLAEFLAETMEVLGFTAHIDNVGNVIGEIGTGDGPTVLLVGHLDTVPGAVPVRNDGARLHGRGASDAQGPLAAMVMAAAQVADFPGRVIVAGVVEEEMPSSRGAVYLGTTIDRPDIVIIGEPGGWSNVVIGYRGKVDLKYRIRRPCTHPTNPVDKATELAAAFWQEALTILDDDHGHAAFDRPGVTLSSMSGDIGEVQMDISYRIPIGFDIDGLVAKLRERAGDADVDVANAVPAVLVDRRNPAVRALSAGIRRTGGTPRFKVKTGTSDMNTLARFWDVPMATYGPGDSRLDHTAEEHTEIKDYLNGISALSAALDELSQLT
jgi:LysW-gamma-L-lysine carboxypeptidase